MTGEQQEAVCGTCGEAIEPGEFTLWRHTKTHGNNGYSHLPAPVVPSDDDDEENERCGREDAERDFARHPPTPSQDAEGDGRIAARRDYDMWLDHNIHAQPTTFETWIAGWDAHESSIRADYEALVKAARVLRDAELRLISTPYEMRQSWDEANDARARAYVSLDNAFREYDARIEGSLGGTA